MVIEPNTSVSHGTMRPEDLIPTFIDTLVRAGEDADDFRRDWDSLNDVPEDARDSRWQESADFLLVDLFDALDVLAPPGCFFGAHPGDGADYGFWEYID